MENKPEKPELLFQYRPPTAWALGNLNRRVLYFNSPLNFNDPHDFRYPPSLRNMTDDHFAFFRDAFARDERLRYRQGESKEEYPHAKLWKAQLNENKYALEFARL